MRYLCLIYVGSDPTASVSEAERKAEGEAYMAFSKEATSRGVMEGGEPLQPPTTATTVRVQNGDTLTTDGPFAETKEWLAGYYVINCKDLDEATEIAAKIPAAKYGSIEVRPIMDFPGPDGSGS
jgi:hypothetical protein